VLIIFSIPFSILAKLSMLCSCTLMMEERPGPTPTLSQMLTPTQLLLLVTPELTQLLS